MFLDRFGRLGKGNGKGKVESLVGYARCNYLVPLPEVPSFAALNAHPGARSGRVMDAAETLGGEQASAFQPPAAGAAQRQTGVGAWWLSGASSPALGDDLYHWPLSLTHMGPVA